MLIWWFQRYYFNRRACGCFCQKATDTYADADGGVPWNAESGATMSPALATAIFWLTSIPESELPDIADEGALQKWRSVLPFSRDGYGFEEDWAEVYTSKNLHQKATQSVHQSRGHQIPFRRLCPDAGADFWQICLPETCSAYPSGVIPDMRGWTIKGKPAVIEPYCLRNRTALNHTPTAQRIQYGFGDENHIVVWLRH